MGKEEVLSLANFEISSASKEEYLKILIGKVHKMLHLFEERAQTGFSPEHFIWGQLWEINAANGLFSGKLIPVIVKIKGIYDDVDVIEIKDVKKQVFEIDKIIKSLMKNLK